MFIHKCSHSLHKCQYNSSYKISNQCLCSCSKYQCYIVVEHSVVHLSSSVPVLFLPLFSLPNIYYFNNRVTDVFHMRLSELCINVSFDILHIFRILICV